ncbi:hypothetical protein PHYPSEUDO_002505 [Phytophthora pseudosyringae]|uniref:Uncharacterized protein n=1 Tax=Phytophthora pseudosyringae TaxID=221518 RepID=A0A8T1VTE9_9STRA|nr:hypothetical protein PHYPSEUDO_002505 [Phytophthora pseudosyringae]
MEKDLRDAYAALKLLRADLVKTRRDKRALEASLSHLQTLGPPPSAAQTRETQQMQREDASAQLWRLAALYEGRLAELEAALSANRCQKREETTPEGHDNQRDEQEAEELEKLALLHKMHSLTATVEQQTQTMLAQQAAFALQKGELEAALEDTQRQLQTEKTTATDALLAQQAAKEKYAFVETQVEILTEEKKALEEQKAGAELQVAAHAQTSSILKQQLQEKDEDARTREAEREQRQWTRQLEHDQKMDALVEELSAKFRQENKEKEEQRSEEHQREVAELQRKMRLVELELSSEKVATLQEQEERRERHAVALGGLESRCEELKTQVADSEAKRSAQVKEHEAKLAEAQEQHATALQELERELEEVRKRLAASEADRTTERKDLETQLEGALKMLRDQKGSQEQQTLVLRDLENNLTEAQAQRAAAEANLAKEVKSHDEKLAEALQGLQDQQDGQERYALTLRDVENDLAEVQAQLADSEAKRLSEVEEYEAKLSQSSQLAAQHVKTTRALAMEKKALQQEVREARQTSKLTTEEFLKCQSMMEQKTQEHLQYLNRVQEQCESLETQLLSAEDHKEPSRADKPSGSSYTLKAFHGISGNEIAALPSSKSWALLRSGINEMDSFLPQFQALLGRMSDVLTLCKRHADILPALCERLEGKIANEKGQLLTLAIAVRLVCFAAMLKGLMQQDEAPVTWNIVETLRRCVVDALAQWYEYDAGDSDQSGNGSMPTPTFTITSRETALILQNWTNDRTKQLGVRRWLARMEAYPGVPPLRGASSNRVLELPLEGCTLELEEMTSEVKDAFLLLLIPILKQNRALHVRVFTRYTGECDTTSKQRTLNSGEDDDAEKLWAMRIHVQSAIAQRAQPIGKPRPAPLKLAPSPRSPPSPLAPTSPASSVSSSTSSTASSRLQIIQERLQYLHNNA